MGIAKLLEMLRSTAYRIDIQCNNTKVTIFSSSEKSLNYIKLLFYPEGVNGIQFVPTIKCSDWNIFSSILDQTSFELTLNDILKEFSFTKSIEPMKGSKYYCYQKGAISAFIFDEENLYASPYYILKVESVLYAVAKTGKADYRVAARLLRELTYRIQINNYQICLHASAIKVDGFGVLFIGDSGVGKTTLGLYMCQMYGGKFLANDRVLISRNIAEKTLIASSFAYAVKLNRGTLVSLDKEQEYSKWNLFDGIPTDGSDWTEFNGNEKLYILPGELKSTLGIDSISTTKIDFIVYPSIENLTNHVIMSTMEMLQKNCFTPYDKDFPCDWLKICSLSNHDLEIIKSSYLTYLQSVPSLRMSYTFDILDQFCRRIIESLSDLRERRNQSHEAK